MYFSARAATGLLGLAGISSGLPTGNTSASAPPTGEIINATATAVTNPTETSSASDILVTAWADTINATAVTNPTATTSTIDILVTAWADTINATAVTNPTETTSASDILVTAWADTINGTEDVNTSATTLPQVTNGTTTTDPFFPNGTEGEWLWLYDIPWLPLTPPKDRRLTLSERRSLDKRGDPPLPPRDRKLADHMENYGQDLPECYKKCMRSEDGKSSIHMGQDTLGQICGIKWPTFAWWSEHHIYWCTNGKNGCQGKQPHRDAYKWLKWTCGDKPN